MTTLPAALARDGRVVQRGRSKAYRPLPADERLRALRAGLDAYEGGDFFEAHELLEPAWMGTDDLGERELYQGLIKLAAGYVHAVRGNATGMARNLAGARDRLAAAATDGEASRIARHAGIRLEPLIADVEVRLSRLAGWAAADGSLDRAAARATLERELPPPATRSAR